MARSPRSMSFALAALAVLSVLSVVAPPAAHASGTAAASLASATNEERSDHRLRHYSVRSDLDTVARRWAAHMAARHTLAHNPRLSREVHNWQQLGENVGVGSSARQVQAAFMHSSPHRANILSRGFLQVGIGTARDDRGRLYVDVVFRRPS